MGGAVWRFGEFTYSALGGLQRDGAQIHLGPQARQLLEALLEARGAVVSKGDIAARLWPDRPASDDSIDRCAYLLRKPIREAGGGDLIATAYGRGLSLRADVETLSPEAEPAQGAEPSPSSRILELWQTAYELAGNRTRDGFARAQAAIAAAAELDPASPPIWALDADIAIGRAVRGFLSPSRAAEMIERAAGRALEISADYSPALAALGWSEGLMRRRRVEGLALLNRSVATDPHYAKARVYRAWLRADLGDLAEAIADINEGLRESPLDQALLSLQAWLTLCRGDHERAATLSRRGLELRPDAATLHLVLSIFDSLAGRHEAAVMAARRGVAASPGDPFVMSVLAYAEATAGRMAEAQETLASACSFDGVAPPLSFLAAATLALGRPDEAVRQLTRARDEGCPWFAFVPYDPRLEPVRPDIAHIRAASACAPSAG